MRQMQQPNKANPRALSSLDTTHITSSSVIANLKAHLTSAHQIRMGIMCLEIYKRFRCGCTEYKDVFLCRYIDEVNDLIDNQGLREDDVKVDKLYEKCDNVGAKRYLAQFTKCARCLAEMALEAGGGKEKGMGTDARDRGGSARLGSPSKVGKRKR